MATKTLKVVRPGRYGTRMLQAGDTYEASAPEARLYAKLGWMEEGEAPVKPKAAAKPKTPRKRRAKKAA